MAVIIVCALLGGCASMIDGNTGGSTDKNKVPSALVGKWSGVNGIPMWSFNADGTYSFSGGGEIAIIACSGSLAVVGSTFTTHPTSGPCVEPATTQWSIDGRPLLL